MPPRTACKQEAPIIAKSEDCRSGQRIESYLYAHQKVSGDHTHFLCGIDLTALRYWLKEEAERVAE